jgi:hypothetical protein
MFQQLHQLEGELAEVHRKGVVGLTEVEELQDLKWLATFSPLFQPPHCPAGVLASKSEVFAP